jgi:hypothetical protein
MRDCYAVDIVEGEAEAGHVERCCAALAPVRLTWRLAWPLSLIVRQADLAAYNSILTFLLQVSPSAALPSLIWWILYDNVSKGTQFCLAEVLVCTHVCTLGLHANAQVRWAEAALQHTRGRQHGREERRGAEAADALAWEMRHFVANLRAFVMDGLVHGAARSFEQARSPFLLVSLLM